MCGHIADHDRVVTPAETGRKCGSGAGKALVRHVHDRYPMIKNLFVSLTLCCLALPITGCGSSSEDNTPFCSTATGGICAPAGFPYVTFAVFRSDACPTPRSGDNVCTAPLSATMVALTQPEAGKLCMKGTVAGQGFAWLILGVSRWNKGVTQIFDLFDASARGIDALELTVDGPPATGLTLFATTAQKTHCSGAPDCLGEGWNLMTGPRSNLVKPIDTSGVLRAPFADFARTDPNAVLDTSKLGHFIFTVNPGAFDFCVSGLKFLDAHGDEVAPAAP